MFLSLNTRLYPRVSGRLLKIARRFVIPLALAMIGGVGLVLAASNFITLNHTATVTTGATLGVIDQGGTAPPSCPLTGYGPGPVSIGWGMCPKAQRSNTTCASSTQALPQIL